MSRTRVGGFFDGGPELVDVERLGEVRVRAVLHGRHDGIDAAVTGDDDDFRFGELGFGLVEDGQAVDVVHLQVGDDDVEVFAFDEGCPLAAGVGHRAIAADALEAFGDGLRMGLVVVDDQDANGDGGKVFQLRLLVGHVCVSTGGSEMVKCVPLPGSLSQVMCP